MRTLTPEERFEQIRRLTTVRTLLDGMPVESYRLDLEAGAVIGTVAAPDPTLRDVVAPILAHHGVILAAPVPDGLAADGGTTEATLTDADRPE